MVFPVVLKLAVNWGGRGVLRCDDVAALARTIDALPPGGRVLVQPLVLHPRCITVQVAAGSAIGAFATLPVGADFRSNVRLGGRTSDVTIGDETGRAAVRAAAACGLRSGSVDFLDVSEQRPGDVLPVIEVNSMPGLWPDDAGDRAFAAAIVAAAVEGAA